MQMVNKTHRSHKGQCMYGRKCCGSSLDGNADKKRRTLKRAERQDWKRDLRNAY